MSLLKDRIKYLRKHFKIKSQSALANTIGVNEARIKSLETGRVKEISAMEANDIVKNFNISFDWLLTGDGDMLLNKSTSSNSVIGDNNVVGSNISISSHKKDVSNIEDELLEDFRKLPKRKQEYYYYKIKSDAIEEELKDE